MRTQDNNQLSRTLQNTKIHNGICIILCLLLFSKTTQLFSQVNKLPEIEITSVNYKYIHSIATEDITELTVRILEEKAALYDPKDYINYNDDYNIYAVRFSMPDGLIQAIYDENGKIIKTTEKFKNVKLPKTIQNAIAKQFPNWSLVKNVYQVSYYDSDCDNSDLTRKDYKLKLKNGKEVVIVKTDEMGNFL